MLSWQHVNAVDDIPAGQENRKQIGKTEEKAAKSPHKEGSIFSLISDHEK